MKLLGIKNIEERGGKSAKLVMGIDTYEAPMLIGEA